MSWLTQAATPSAILLPAFIGCALLFAILPRHRALILAAGCAVLAVIMAGRTAPPTSAVTAAGELGIEVDMMVSRGNMVELWCNDWQHPPERVPVVAGQRHVYRFSKLPANISLIRLDPTDVPDARFVIYSLAVKAGNEVLRQFGPSELKGWTLHEVSAPQDEDGGLALADTSGDPILWTAVNIALPARKEASPAWFRQYFASLFLGILALGLVFGGQAKGLPYLGGWVVGLLILGTAFGVDYLQTQSAEAGIGIEVDMQVSRGQAVDLWCNDWKHPAERLPLVAGDRHVYRFTNVPQTLTLLRLDPTDQADSRMVIYGVSIRNRSQVFQQFGPGELKTWKTSGLSVPQEENGGLLFTDLNNDPMLFSPMAIRLPGSPLATLAALVETEDGPFLLAIVVLLAIMLLRTSTRAGRMQAVAMALSCCVAWPVVTLVLKLDLLPPPPVRLAVGYASYIGYDKSNEFLSAMVTMLVCVGLGYLFAKFGGTGEEEAEQPVVGGHRVYGWMAQVLVTGLVFLHYLPDLHGALGPLSNVVYQHVDWDASVGLHWQEMVNLGMMPIRDFWYPYSGGFLHQLLPFPADRLWWCFHCTVLLSAFYLAIFKISSRRVTHALTIFGLILPLVFLELIPGWNRYLLSVTVALFYATICDVPRFDWKKHVPFGLFVGYAFFYEPTQIIYAGTGIAAHTILTALAEFRGGGWLRVLKQRLICVAAPMGAGITASLLVYGALGMLPNLVAFERTLGAMGDYCAWPSEINKWVMPVLQPETGFLVMFLLASFAAYRWVEMKGRPDPLGTALIVLSFVTYMAVQKQVLRPAGMTAQMRVFPYVAMLIFGLMIWRERRAATRLAMVIFAGGILGIAMHRQLLADTFARDIAAGPLKVRGAVEGLLHDQKEIARVNATLFARSRFAGFETEMAVVDQLAQSGLRPEDSVYVLGDHPAFYMLLPRRPPYVSNMYNDSPLSEQRRVLEWFREKKPRYVIWGTDALGFDTVPHMVRLPLIYTYVVEHYEFLRAVGPYHILAERPAEHAVDLEYWRRVLTERVDLGYIPGLARSSEYGACEGDRSHCDAVLVVKFGQAPKGKETVDIGPYRVQFDLTPREREYVVNLQRLWFWGAVSGSGARVAAEDGASAVVEYRKERGAVLW